MFFSHRGPHTRSAATVLHLQDCDDFPMVELQTLLRKSVSKKEDISALEFELCFVQFDVSFSAKVKKVRKVAVMILLSLKFCVSLTRDKDVVGNLENPLQSFQILIKFHLE